MKENNELSEYKNIPCQVCGDIASGKNYKVYSCESCKTFFKRTSVIAQKLKCVKSGNCPIDFATRKCCSYCRYQRCIFVGMRCKVHRIKPLESYGERARSQKIASPIFPNSVIVAHVSPVRVSIDNFLTEFVTSHNDLLETEPFDCLEHTYSRKRNYANDLTRYEWSLLEELQEAMEVFPDERTLPVVERYPTLKKTWNYPQNYGAVMVKFCHRMRAFNLINHADQMIIFKPFYMEMLALRLIFILDDDKDGGLVYANESATEVAFVSNKVEDELKGLVTDELIQQNEYIIKTLKDEMENDPIIRDLLIAYCMFQPRPLLSCPEFIRYQHRIYSRLLLRYFEHKFKNARLANQKYSRIANTINLMEDMRRKSKGAFCNVDTSSFSDLVLELYDLAGP